MRWRSSPTADVRARRGRHARRADPRGARAFTLVEITVVVAAGAVLTALAVAGVVEIVSAAKRDVSLRSVYTDVQQQRAIHLASVASVKGCLRVRGVGAANELELEELADCSDPGTSVSKMRKRFSVASVTLNTTAALEACIDYLARPFHCVTGAVRPFTIDVDADGNGRDGTITWNANGRVTASFSAETGAEEQAHLADIGSAKTPNPTKVGAFSGMSTNPAGLLE